MSSLHPTFQEPDIQIDDTILDLWRHDQFANAEALLNAAIHGPRIRSHALASRALIRARLRQWDAAIADTTAVCVAPLSHALSLIYIKSIKIQPSVIGYIAKSVALVGNGEKHKAYRACDIAFERFHSTHVTFLLLIKVCVPCTRAWLPSRSYSPGYHRVYGRRACRRDIPRRRPHRYGGVQINVLRGSGTCITRYHTTNITTDVSNRHICIFSLETRTWRVATTRVRYYPSRVHEPKCDPTRVEDSLWSHW